MILTGQEIEKMVHLGKIIIEPFESKQLNPNSYNYRLGKFYRTISLDEHMKTVASEVMEIPNEGLLLQPHTLYLASTAEVIGSSYFVTSLIGRSSVGRLGLFLQCSADLGNLGNAHCWTLELKCVQPIWIYPNMIIGQVSFWESFGEITEYTGQYTNYSLPMGKIKV